MLGEQKAVNRQFQTPVKGADSPLWITFFFKGN
jgi:hypothetical protein